LLLERDPITNNTHVSLPPNSVPGEEFLVQLTIENPDGEDEVSFWTILNKNGTPWLKDR